MEEVHNLGGLIPQASPQLYEMPRYILVWFDKYNSAIMSGSVPQASIGKFLSPPKINKKDPNENNWYHEMIDNMQNNTSQLAISQSDLNPPKIPIAQTVGQSWFPPQEWKLFTNQDTIFKTPQP